MLEGDIPNVLSNEALMKISMEAYDALLDRVEALLTEFESKQRIFDHSAVMSVVATHIIPTFYAALRDNPKAGPEAARQWLVAALSDIGENLKLDGVLFDFKITAKE